MEIRVEEPGQEQRSIAVTMRTPGHDFELAAGFLFTEGLITIDRRRRDVRYCTVPADQQQFNVVSVTLTRDAAVGRAGAKLLRHLELRRVRQGLSRHDRDACRRRWPMGRLSAPMWCWVCPTRCAPPRRCSKRPAGCTERRCSTTPASFWRCARTWAATTPSTRSSARAFLAGDVPLSGRVLLVSGRSSFEIVQKAAMAGIPMICAVSAPSSLAVDAARRFGITLIGFLRGSRFNIYTSPERID